MPGVVLKLTANQVQKHIPPSPFVYTPDAAPLVNKTFSHVAANVPFPVRGSSWASRRSVSPASPMMNRVNLEQNNDRPSTQTSRVGADRDVAVRPITVGSSER